MNVTIAFALPAVVLRKRQADVAGCFGVKTRSTTVCLSEIRHVSQPVVIVCNVVTTEMGPLLAKR
jgi:hypothetical protein